MSQSPTPFPDAPLRAVLARFAAARARAAALRTARAEDASEEGAEENVPTASGGTRFAYLDAFAGAEFAFGTGVARAADEETRAAAVLRALAEAAPEVAATAALVEEDPAYLQRIYADLERIDAAERVRGVRDFAALSPGEIALAECPFAAAAEAAAGFAAEGAGVAWLAPPSARQLPWSALRPLVERTAGEVLLRVPHADWEKQGRVSGPLADLPAFARRIVEGCSAMLDDARHGWLPAWRATEREGGFERAMADVLERIGRLLADAAPGRLVRAVRLAPGGEDGGPVTHLFLVAADAVAALELNEAIRDAGLVDRDAERIEPEAAPPVETAEEGPMLDLFGGDLPAPPKERAERSDPIAAAELLARENLGRTTTWGELARRVARTDLGADELRRALEALRRSGRAAFRALEVTEDEVEFPAEPRKAAPKRKKARAREEEGAGLFEGMEEG